MSHLDMDLHCFKSALNEALGKFEAIELSLVLFESGVKMSDVVIMFAEAQYVGQHSPVVEVRHQIAKLVEEGGQSNKELAEPKGRWGKGMVGIVSGGCIYIGDVRVGVVAVLVQHGHLAVVQLFDPVCWLEESVGVWNNEGGMVAMVAFESVGDFSWCLVFLKSDLDHMKFFAEINFTILELFLSFEQSSDQSLGDSFIDLMLNLGSHVGLQDVGCRVWG